MSAKQQQILNKIREKGEPMTKQDLLIHFGHWYFRNEAKHLGDVLSRMVNSGLLCRPKRGYYYLGSKPVPPNQMSLF